MPAVSAAAAERRHGSRKSASCSPPDWLWGGTHGLRAAGSSLGRRQPQLQIRGVQQRGRRRAAQQQRLAGLPGSECQKGTDALCDAACLVAAAAMTTAVRSCCWWAVEERYAGMCEGVGRASRGGGVAAEAKSKDDGRSRACASGDARISLSSTFGFLPLHLFSLFAAGLARAWFSLRLGSALFRMSFRISFSAVWVHYLCEDSSANLHVTDPITI